MPIHPSVAELLQTFNAEDAPKLETMPVEEARALFNSLGGFFPPPVEVAAVENLQTPTGIPIRLYRADASPGISPVVFFIHGGGWVLGSIETHDTTCRQLCQRSSVTVISVEYRLAPEHPFPKGLDDAWEALQYITSKAEELRIDPRRLALAGDSAGANLAAAVAIRARDAGKPVLRYQLLIYPVISSAMDTESYKAFGEKHGLSYNEMAYFWNAYIGRGDRQAGLASLDQVQDLTNLPRTLVLTAEYDVLRDEAEAFAGRLKAAAVEVETIRIDGVIHGFIHYAGAIPPGLKTLDLLSQKLKAALV